MTNKKIVKKIADKFNKDPRVINVITRHPFKFFYDVMNDPVDDRPVRYMYLGVFSQKNARNKLDYIYGNNIKQSSVLLGNRGL